MHAGWNADEEIDRVVREMTEVEPSRSLTARVMARTREPRRTVWFTPARFAFAGALATVVLAAVLLLPGSRPPDVETSASRSIPTDVPPPRPTPHVQTAPPAPPLAVPVHGGRVIYGRAGQTAHALPPPAGTVVVAPLDPIAPIQPRELATAPIEPVEIAVPLLNDIPPVEVEPIPAPGGRS